MRGSLILLWQLSVLLAMPYSNKWAPTDVTRKTDKYVLLLVSALVESGDQFFQHYYGPWWTAYKAARLAEQIRARGDPEPTYLFPGPPIEEFWKEDFIDYPIAPVQAYAAERFCPIATGWRKGRWGCYLGCQDIRTTIEWILGRVLAVDVKRQVRARRPPFGFMCPEGKMSVTRLTPSIREAETPEQKAAAIALLKHLFFATLTDKESVYGDESPFLTTCECIEAMPEVMRAEAKICGVRDPETRKLMRPALVATSKRKREHVESLPNHSGLSTSARKRLHKQAAKRDLPRRQRLRHPGPSSVRQNVPFEDQIPREDEEEHEDDEDDEPQEERTANLTEEAGPSNISCYDFDYPELQTTMPQQAASTEEDFRAELEYVRATIQAMSSFDEWWQMAPADSQRSGKGHKER